MIDGAGGHRRARRRATCTARAAGSRTTTPTLARHRADRRRRLGHLADGRRVALHCTSGTTTTSPRDRALLAARLPADEGRRAVLPRHAGGGAARTAGWSPARRSRPRTRIRPGRRVCAGPTMDMQILRDLFDDASQAAELLGIGRGVRERDARAARARLAPTRSARRASCRSGWRTGTWRRPSSTTATSRTCTACFPSATDHAERHADARRGRAKRSLEIRGDEATGWASRGSINLWARLARRRPRATSILDATC